MSFTGQSFLGPTTRLPRWLMLLGILALLAPGSAITHAQDSPSGGENQVAGLIVDTGDQDPLYALVAFTESDMNAIDLLRAANLPLVTVEFGGLGEGVCEIVETGCDVSPCRRRLCQTGDPESPFWQLWKQDETGEWSRSVLGGNQTSVSNGDIVAWAWTGVEPSLPSEDLSAIASRAGAPDKITRPGAWHTAPHDTPDDAMPSTTNMLLSASVLILIAGAGITLARLRRRHKGTTP